MDPDGGPQAATGQVLPRIIGHRDGSDEAVGRSAKFGTELRKANKIGPTDQNRFENTGEIPESSRSVTTSN